MGVVRLKSILSDSELMSTIKSAIILGRLISASLAFEILDSKKHANQSYEN